MAETGSVCCRAVRSVIGHPFQHGICAVRRLVETFWRPQHPCPLGRVAFARKDLQGEKLASVLGAMPTDRAVAVGRDDDATIFAGVHRPSFVRALPSPFLRPGVVKRCERVARAQVEALGTRSNGEASPDVVFFERKRSAIQRRIGSAEPVVNCQAFTDWAQSSDYRSAADLIG